MYHSNLSEADVLGEVSKGDAIGLRLSADRAGFCVFKIEAAADANGKRGERHLKYISCVLSFPMRVMAVFGTSAVGLGPTYWLRTPQGAPAAAPKDAAPAPAAVGVGGGWAMPRAADGGPSDSAKSSGGWAMLGPPDAESGAAEGKVVKGRHAGDLLSDGTVDASGNVLLLKTAAEGSWAAGTVQRLKPKAVAKATGVAAALVTKQAKERARSALMQPAALAARAEEAARSRAQLRAALQPKVVAKERLVPKGRDAPAPAPSAAPAPAAGPSANSANSGADADVGWETVDADVSADNSAISEPSVPMDRVIWLQARTSRTCRTPLTKVGPGSDAWALFTLTYFLSVGVLRVLLTIPHTRRSVRARGGRVRAAIIGARDHHAIAGVARVRT